MQALLNIPKYRRPYRKRNYSCQTTIIHLATWANLANLRKTLAKLVTHRDGNLPTHGFATTMPTATDDENGFPESEAPEIHQLIDESKHTSSPRL